MEVVGQRYNTYPAASAAETLCTKMYSLGHNIGQGIMISYKALEKWDELNGKVEWKSVNLCCHDCPSYFIFCAGMRR